MPLSTNTELSSHVMLSTAETVNISAFFVADVTQKTPENGAIKFSLFKNAWNNIAETLDFSEFQQDTA